LSLFSKVTSKILKNIFELILGLQEFISKVWFHNIQPEYDRRTTRITGKCVNRRRKTEYNEDKRETLTMSDYKTRANLQIPLLTVKDAIDYISMFTVRSIYSQ
jgi:hypothetical protein